MAELRTSAFLAVLLVAAVAATAGCRGRALAPNANDALRAELATRTTERDAAVARASELETKLKAAEAARVGGGDPEADAARPALARIAVSSLTTARIRGSAEADLALVVVPTDGLGRIVQVAGTLKVSVAALVPGSEPVPAGSLVLRPLELRERYRTGFMGTHYTVEIPLAWRSAGGVATAFAVAVEFTDGASGRAFTASATVPAVSTDSRP
ncbi:MAG: hypothetical protein ACKO0W_10965 [Planctomycetota bacterium]